MDTYQLTSSGFWIKLREEIFLILTSGGLAPRCCCPIHSHGVSWADAILIAMVPDSDRSILESCNQNSYFDSRKILEFLLHVEHTGFKT